MKLFNIIINRIKCCFNKHDLYVDRFVAIDNHYLPCRDIICKCSNCPIEIKKSFFRNWIHSNIS